MKPNILFFFPDQWRWDWLGSNKKLPLKTPNLDYLSQNGIVFNSAICPSPLCAPSRASLASGREYKNCGVRSNAENYPLQQETFYKLLRDKADYQVLGCGKFDLHKPDFNWGVDGKHLLNEWGFSDGVDNEGKIDSITSSRNGYFGPYISHLKDNKVMSNHIDDMSKRITDGVNLSTFPTPLKDDFYCDNWLAENGLNLIKETPANKPWFLQVNFTGPHTPWDITKSMSKLYKDQKFPMPINSTEYDESIHLNIRRNYAAMIENIDNQIGKYLDYLKESGLLENTLIVFSSDHGDMLGDHDLWGKCQPFHGSVAVPLIVSGPGVLKSEAYDGVVTTMDLAATFLDYACLEVPTQMDSCSLKQQFEGGFYIPRNVVTSALNFSKKGKSFNWKLAFDGRYKLIHDKNKELYLFDIKSNPDETTNIKDTFPEIVEKLERHIKL
ncbi:MAG: sulfatase-like hydrolase/transferase [Spirochaetaceae bacterium]